MNQILEIFIKEPEREFHVREIAKLLKKSPTTISKYLKTYESKKFLTAIGSIENTLNATGRTAKSTWDEFGRVTVNVTNTSKGLVENFKYQWDAVNQSLVRVNRQQQDNMLSIDQLQAKYKGMTNTLNNGKLGNFIDKSALQSFENSLKNIQVLDAKILADLKNQFDQIKLNAQANKENFNLGQNLDVYKNRMNIVIVRPENIYGTGQKEENGYVIHNFIKAVKKGKTIKINGNGKQTRDFIYIGDVADTIDKLIGMDVKSGTVISLGTGRETNIIDLAKIIGKTLKKNTTIEFLEKREEPFKSVADVRDLSAMGVNTKKFVVLEKGIKKIAEFRY